MALTCCVFLPQGFGQWMLVWSIAHTPRLPLTRHIQGDQFPEAEGKLNCCECSTRLQKLSRVKVTGIDLSPVQPTW